MSDQAPELNASVLHRQDLTPRLAIVRVAPEGWTLPDFEPGQWATLGLPEPDAGDARGGAGPALVKRVYSVASPPGLPYLEFFIQLVKEGEFTTRLWPLEAGDRLWLSPKLAGQFTLAPAPPGSRLVFAGTGTGLAPFVSMARWGAAQPRRPWSACVLIHGARDASELAYRQELEGLASKDPSFHYLPTLTREGLGSKWTGRRGRVQSLFLERGLTRATGVALEAKDTHIFLCGNPEMIDDLERRLAPLGFRHHTRQQAGNLHFERYW